MAFGIRRKKADLDSMMSDQHERDSRGGAQGPGGGFSGGEPVGTVEHFYDHLGVAAIKLSGPLKVGDVIEIGTSEEAVRQKVSSMQIDRKDVAAAGAGDSVGIMLKWKVNAGSEVYKVG